MMLFNIMMKNNGIVNDNWTETYLKENVCSLVMSLNSLVEKKDNVILNQPPNKFPTQQTPILTLLPGGGSLTDMQFVTDARILSV